MSRSRAAWSPVRLYSAQRAPVSSCRSAIVAEDRRKSGFREISAVFLPEQLERELPHPDGEEHRRERDHPEHAALVGRVEPEQQEAGRKDGEERSQGPPAHPGTMPPRRGP